MARFAILLAPAANRVYGRSAPALSRAELTVVNDFALEGRLSDLGEVRLGGVPYVTFSGSIDVADIAVLSNLSALYALFERERDDRLRPIDVSPLDRWDDDLITIQRYSGKTNEQFTKLLVNLAVVAGHGGDALRQGSRIRLIDPLCGRGTTLNQAVMYGFDAAGVDDDARDVDAYLNFFVTWLRNNRAVHRVERRGKGATVTFAKTRGEQSQTGGQRVVVVADDTTRAVDHLGKNTMDALVADLPYGVQHGSRATGSNLSRRPLELLDQALPVWRSLLRPGSAMALAWNTRTLSRLALIEALHRAGLEIIDPASEASFAHQVDRSIARDVVLARRPK